MSSTEAAASDARVERRVGRRRRTGRGTGGCSPTNSATPCSAIPTRGGAGFIVNTIDEDSISGWSFEYGYHQRVWWVDGGDQPPLVILAGVPSGIESFREDADRLIDSITIGEPGPHPVPNPGT